MHTSLQRIGFTVAGICVSVFLLFSLLIVGITAAPPRAHAAAAADAISSVVDVVMDNLPMVIMVGAIVFAPEIAAAMSPEISYGTAASLAEAGLSGAVTTTINGVVYSGFTDAALLSASDIATYSLSVSALGVGTAGAALGAVALGASAIDGGSSSVSGTSPMAGGSVPQTTPVDGGICYSPANSCGQAYQGTWSINDTNTIGEGNNKKFNTTTFTCSVADYVPPDSKCPVPPPDVCPAGLTLQYVHLAKSCTNGTDACTVAAQAPTASRVAWNPDSVAAGNGCSLGYWSGNTGNYCWQNPVNGVCPLNTDTNGSPVQGSFDYAAPRQLAGSTYTAYGTSHEAALMCYVPNVPTCLPDANVSVSCTGSPGNALINQPVTWSASAKGGSGSYTYQWSGTDNLFDTTPTTQKSYTTTGTKQATVLVTDSSSGKTATASCTSSAGTGVDVEACSSSISADPTTVEQGQNTALSWSTTGGALCASSCTGSGFNTGGATSGSSVLASVLPTPPSTTYSLSCSGGTYGPPPTANVTVTVIPPTATITANGQTGTARVNPATANNTTVAWSSVKAVSCSITKNSAKWKTGLSSAGVIDTVTAQTTYGIDCVNRYGAHVTNSVIVNVLAVYKEF